MAKVTYTLLDRPLSSITDNEKYSEADLSLIDNYEINKQYNFDKHYIESHFYSIYNTKLLSVYDYELPTEVIVNNEDLSTTNVTQLSLRPQDIAVEYGFVQTDVSIVFHFLNDLYTIDNAKQSFYIQDISQDRKEILLYSDKIETNQLINITEDLKDHFRDNQYFEELWLNCGENDLFIVTNVDTYELEDKFTIALKLYEPLPKRYGIKSFVQVVEKVSDSIVVQVEPEVEPAIVVKPKLRPANFDVKLELPNANPTQYFNYDELFSYDNSNSNRELYSILNEKSVAVNIDHNNYKEFIHFSSATERLKNFKYKLQLIESYQTSLDTVNGLSATNTVNVVGSNSRYTNLIKGIVGNFDHYERHLYFDSGSSSWPKITSTKPYTNTVSTEMTAVNWYNSQLISASNYDAQNYDVLGNALPEYIRDDNANNPGVLFTHMIGQHFDNLWIYTKAITDKYNADNRVNVGVSKDLVKEAIKSLGVKIHNSEEGSTDLFKYLIADAYDSGSQLEVITQFNSVPGISADEQPISRKEYETEVYKRIYHNIPFLTKAKGTQRGIRALINCFGIPSEFLKIKQYGGKSIGESKFFNYDKHSEDANAKVRIETRVSGSVNTTLSEDVSIQKSENVLTQDIHRVEVGFSPTDSIDEYILTQLASDFSIDQYLGDPRNENKLEYNGLVEQERRTIGSLERYQLNDFVRILKFYDNTLFKMIKDFLPARTTADTGIIIKPGLLSKSKTKAPEMTGTQHDHEGAIDTAFIEGSDAGAYDTALFSKTEKYQTELINKWSPGNIGGASNLSFKLNKQIPDTDNAGEIVVTGTKLIHPNGTEYTYLDRGYNIFTGLEGNTNSHRKSFLMHSDQGVVARFPTLTTLTDSTHHPNIVVVLYDNNSWNAVDNNSTMATFTPLASDLIIASIGMTPNAGQIDEFYSFMKSFINYKPEIKTTLYSQKVKTISGLVHKLVQDESPKYNGELSGSVLEITDGELNSLNNFKIVDAPLLRYDVTTVESTFSGVLTPFIVNPNSQAAAITACNLSGVSATVTFYHDAFTALPGINGVIYKDSGANALLDGGQNFYLHPGSSQAFQIDTDGTVMSIVDCGQFDNIPGAPPTPASAFRSKIVNNGNKSLVPIVITNAEAGTTANITASLGTDKVLKAISIPSQGYASTNLDLTTIPDTTGTEIALSVKLTDQAGNQSLESTVNTDIGSFGKTIVKDTQPISGHTVTFVTSFLGSTPQMTNTTGAFFMKVTGLPTTEQVSYNATISSTGGVISSYVSGLNLNGFNNGSGNSTGHISLFSSQHNFNNGTVTVYLTVVDAAGNQSLSITDTVLYSSGNASMSPSTVSQGSNAGTGTIQITSNTSWSLYSYSNWISLSSGSGTGNAIRTWSTSTNYGGSRTGYVKLSTGGNIVDTLTITQSAGGSNSQACVDPETDITLEHGDTIKARDIKTGDIVRTKHETTMEMLSCIVIGAQLVPFSRKLKIVYSDRDLICSLRHRVYVDNKSEFIAADLLEVGDITTGYEIVDIVEVEEGEVIKLSVEKAQTYISNGILSHNVKTIQ
jgi:hypothetical protein